jgi:porphobilinogen deaminase
MPAAETPLEIAERHVAEGEHRIARQKELIEELVRDKHDAVVHKARDILATLEESLRLARIHLEIEREHDGQSRSKA